MPSTLMVNKLKQKMYKIEWNFKFINGNFCFMYDHQIRKFFSDTELQIRWSYIEKLSLINLKYGNSI